MSKDSDISKESPKASDLMRWNLQEAKFSAMDKWSKISQKSQPSTPGGVIFQAAEMGVAVAKPLGKAALHGIQAFVEATPPELTPPVLSSYKDENGETKWGHFPASDTQNEKFDFSKDKEQRLNQTQEKTFDLKKDKMERQLTSENSGQKSRSHDEKKILQSHSKDGGQSR
jgi:hypothetical protein